MTPHQYSNPAVISLYCSILLILMNFETVAQTTKNGDIEKFTITIEEVSPSVLKLKCPSNCAWLELSYYTKYDPVPLIDEYGMINVYQSRLTKDERLADFLFSIQLIENQIQLKGLQGTAWTELNFPLPKDGSREFNESGVEEY